MTTRTMSATSCYVLTSLKEKRLSDIILMMQIINKSKLLFNSVTVLSSFGETDLAGTKSSEGNRHRS